MSEFERVPQPADGDERRVLTGWLTFHRNELEAMCVGLTDEQLVERMPGPSSMSLLGLVRHMAEMERVHGVWANGCSRGLVLIWGSHTAGDPDHASDCDVSQVAGSMRAWREEKRSTDDVIRCLGLDDVGGANGRSVRWNLQKLVGEYARHNGHADLLRERVVGATRQSSLRPR